MSQPLLTPLGHPLNVPKALLKAVTEEMQSHGDKKGPLKFERPLYQLTSQAIDFIAPDRKAVLDTLKRYFTHEGTCYFQLENKELYAQQTAQWLPLHVWAQETLGISLVINEGLGGCAHEQVDVDRVTALLVAQSDLALSGLMGACSLTASLIISLALKAGYLTGREAFDLAYLEESFQNMHWGVDAETAARHTQVRNQLLILTQYFDLID